MKITIVPKEMFEQSEVKLQNLECGTVVELGGGSIKALVIMKIDDTKKLMLLTNCSKDWFSESVGWADSKIEKVIGKLIEIVIEEI